MCTVQSLSLELAYPYHGMPALVIHLHYYDTVQWYVHHGADVW